MSVFIYKEIKMKKKKLKYSSVSISDELLEACYKRHEEESGFQREYISKKNIVSLILSIYAQGGEL